jgi:hypothetical protein
MGAVDWYVHWVVICGLALNLWLGVKLGGLLGRLAYSVVAATSYVRFAWACAKVHGFRPRKYPAWMYAPQIWCEFFVVELCGAKGSISSMGGAGTWNGIGDWTVFPAKAQVV